MRKLISFFVIIFLVTIISISAHALTLGWDSYTDPVANVLILYNSTNGTDFTAIVSDIPTTAISVEVAEESERVYYLLKAYDSDTGDYSGPSNIVTYYWGGGGGGQIGPASVGGLEFINCDLYDAMDNDDGSVNWDTCFNRHNKPQ